MRTSKFQRELTETPGGGVLPYMGYIGMCRCEGYGFQAANSRIGYINQSVWVQNRGSFFRKLISWLKILSRLGTQLLQDRGIWGVYSSIGQQNSVELALVQVKGSRVPAAHPHPEIPKVPPPGRDLSILYFELFFSLAKEPQTRKASREMVKFLLCPTNLLLFISSSSQSFSYQLQWTPLLHKVEKYKSQLRYYVQVDSSHV